MSKDGQTSSTTQADEFGANEWLLEDLSEQFAKDPASVDRSWIPVLERYAKEHAREGSAAAAPAAAAAAPTAAAPVAPQSQAPAQKSAPTPAAAPAPPAAAAPATAERRPHADPDEQGPAESDRVTRPSMPLRVPQHVSPVSTATDVINVIQVADGVERAAHPADAPIGVGTAPESDRVIARTTRIAPQPTPIPADLPSRHEILEAKAEHDKTFVPLSDEHDPIRGVAKTLAANMDASLSVPTATSVRTIPAKVLIDNRIVINNHLSRSRGGKVSFTHLIGWALVKALELFPSQNVYYEVVDGKPQIVHPGNVTLGIAIDLPKPDGTRTLMVPGIRYADSLSFNEYLASYEDIVARARANKLTADDFKGVTISLTNPGGIGTVHSVPRLMAGQGCIIGAGALEYPAEFQGASSTSINELGISKVITLTSTYDHRVIQGAGSGEFLKIVHGLLLGEHGFYDSIFEALRIPYEPVRWASDFSIDMADDVNKAARVQEIIRSYRVRGHLMADTDPLEYRQRKHPDLDILTYGLSLWDLDRDFVTGGFGGRRVATLRQILGTLRDSYCRTIGVEFMHIQDPERRMWLQNRVEQPYSKPTADEQLHILGKLNEAEAFETFLQTKYVGQKRFSLEGGESMIALLDEVLNDASRADIDEVGIGMAHRGRLNVLTNIAGKTYGQVFTEFEGRQEASMLQGTGDVKYHLGTEGEFEASDGKKLKVYLAANPSHLEAVDGVLEGIVRAKQDKIGKPGEFTVLPILIHGDAAFAGQGSVYEALQMSQLRGYRTGGTIHIIVNNQIGFTTKPLDSRSSVYPSDVGRAIQAPVFHVNGDDPEAVVRVGRLALDYRQRFHTDVVIDMVCYRRRGHNEGDDPSMTQPLMYSLVEAKRSVRVLYQEALVGRGDITADEAEQANRAFHSALERAFLETHAASTKAVASDEPVEDAIKDIARPDAQNLDNEASHEPATTGVSADVISLIGEAHENMPVGFTVHPKLKALLQRRLDMSRHGNIDWAYAELLALGSLLLEGVPVRLTGQDSRRGTFVQRHAVFHDHENGQEWLPLTNLSDSQGRFSIYDSLLSEFAVLGFEYGYSVEHTKALVLWEAQFGDFVNGAQTIIDEFISSAEQKWGQHSSLTLLLPHGYDGQGPDHSSARIERFLQLCAQDNMIVAQPSTPASYFHLLRHQAYARPHRPLIVFTPKSMLRLRAAVSQIDDFTSGIFQPILDDPRDLDPAAVKRVVLVSGKFYWDLARRLEADSNTSIALVRVEQLYPVAAEEANRILGRYPNAEIVWAQEEPENQGAWPFIQTRLAMHLRNRTLRGATRPASASPAVGTLRLHTAQEDALIASILG